MAKSGVILDYHGPVDLAVIDLLLKNLKISREYTNLNTTTSKRTYAMVVECLENIYNHSVFSSSEDKRMQPHISVILDDDDKIRIMSGNTVTNNSKDKLINHLDSLNQADEAALKTLHENKISSHLKQNENGAGLGLIFMAMKSGNSLKYSFKPMSNDYFYFEIQISINKYIMRKLIIDQTPSSPKVILDPEKKIYNISGESRPPDVREFYGQILSWMDEFSFYLLNYGDMKDPVIFNFNLEYFNSSSGKLILDICKVLADLRSKGFNISLKWHFEKDDLDMLEVGKEISKIVRFPFEYIQTGVN